MDRLPIFLQLSGKSCLVVGGGTIASRKVRLVLRTGAKITVVAPDLTPELRKLCDSGSIAHAAGQYRPRLIRERWLIVAATDDAALNRRVAADAEAAGRWCNVVDDNDASSFIFPAIVDRSPVIVAISTSGNAPVLARQLKTKIEAWLPARIGELALQAGHWRALVKKRFGSLRERRRFWQRFFDGPVAEHILANRQRDAERALRKELLGPVESIEKEYGEAWIVGAGPGDPGLVTLRAQQLISRADVVLYDRLVSSAVLDFARKEAELISVGKRAGAEDMSQTDINALLVQLVRQGKRVCRLKGGDPFVFGRGGEEALALADAGLPFQIVPGISAALGCAAYAGIPLTLRGVSGSVTLATARLDGGLSPDWPALLKAGQTLALYMGVGSLAEISKQLIKHDVSPQLPVAIIENGTTRQQRTLHTTVSALAEDAANAGIRAPAMLLFGEVVAIGERLQWFAGASHHAEAFSWNIGKDELAAALVS